MFNLFLLTMSSCPLPRCSSSPLQCVSRRALTHDQNVNSRAKGSSLSLAVPRAVSQCIRKEWELCSWAHCHSTFFQSLFLSPPRSFFSFLHFLFCSRAAARRREQHEQTGFLSFAAFIHRVPLLRLCSPSDSITDRSSFLKSSNLQIIVFPHLWVLQM